MTLRQLRFDFSNDTQQDKKADLGQYMTPSSIAGFMTDLFSVDCSNPVHLLDPGGGKGALTVAFLEKWASDNTTCTTYEIDEKMRFHFSRNIERYSSKHNIYVEIIPGDFIEHAVYFLKNSIRPQYTHIIMNPPYKKISSKSNHRLLLREVGIETVNLYSAFMSLAILLAKPGCQISAIIPRSFCNGPYYKFFRNLVINSCSIKHLHLFESRNQAFSDDNVLQENVIIFLVKGYPQDRITISTSNDSLFLDYKQDNYAFTDIVNPDDPEKFIRFPTMRSSVSFSLPFNNSLKDLGLDVCTGPVVDFRVKEYLLDEPIDESVPLLYGSHFSNGHICWPKAGKKPNAIKLVPETNKWLMPRGNYVLTKRFSSKEERRRIVANLLLTETLNYPLIGFENHLNVFHKEKHGFDRDLARGLGIYLNSTPVDEFFRGFSGHTQVNATDLRNLKYPSYEQLQSISNMYSKCQQDAMEIDKVIESIL